MNPPQIASYLAGTFPPLFHIAIGLGITILLGFGVGALLRRAGKSIPLPPPRGASENQKQQWDELVNGNEGGVYIGWLERLMFFAAFLVDAPIAIGAWLALKVASKWNSLDNVTSIPNKIEGLDDFDFLVARRRWGSHLFMTFLLGTGYNIIAGLVGATIARQWCNLFGC